MLTLTIFLMICGICAISIIIGYLLVCFALNLIERLHK